MASKVLPWNAPVWNLVSVIFLFFIVSGSSTTHYVGGEFHGWKPAKSKHVPDHMLPLNCWARSARFQVSDYLEWNIINPSDDSVLRVSHRDYRHCKTGRPIARFLGGKVRVPLDRGGSFFFISGNRKLCKMGEKLHVVVLSLRPKLTAPETVDLPARRPAPTSYPLYYTPSFTTGPVISSGSSSLAPTSTAVQTGILLFILAVLAVCQ